MTKYKLSKDDAKKLRVLAGQLPKTYQDGGICHVVLGKELINQGKTHLDNDKPIIPTKLYKVKNSDKRPVNHFKRLCTAYRQGGVDRAKKYCEQVFTLNNTQFVPKFNNPFA